VVRSPVTFFTPEDIEQYEFLLGVPGYNRAEVRAFLQAIATQLRQTEMGAAESADGPADADDRLAALESAVGELIRAAEIRIEDVANRVVGEFESVRAEIAQLLRALDLRSAQMSTHAPPAAAPVEEPVLEENPAVAEPVLEENPAVAAAPADATPEIVIAAPDQGEDGATEVPPEWDDLFAEPRMDPLS
jgi:DivIVA domain-containing protein